MGKNIAKQLSFPHGFSISVKSCYAENVEGYNKTVVSKQKQINSNLKKVSGYTT